MCAQGPFAITPHSAGFLVDLEPIGRRIEVAPGTDLLTAAQKAGVDLVAACSGIGICGTCRVRLVSGKLSPLTSNEEEQLTTEQIAEGYRLACQASPLSDVCLDIPAESLPVSQKMQVDGQETAIDLDPAVIPVDITLCPPALEDLRADLTRANQALATAGYAALRGDLAVLAALSDLLRGHEWSARLAIHPRPEASYLAAAMPPGSRLLGLAVDMGSTKLAVYLVDLDTGATLAKTGVMNPQIAYGEDVVSRIAFANKGEENHRLLQTRLVSTLNEALEALCRQAGVLAEQIVDAVMVGNTAMHHFLCGLPVAQLGAAPYVAAVSEALEIKAGEIGLHLAPGAWIYLPPNIAGYVGGDHTAALLAAQSRYASGSPRVVVDIGTNTEISVQVGEQIYSCSTASGPAFEGAHIRDGMRAAPGAIERVRFDRQQVHVTTIGDSPPVGICGTGILTAISEMLEAGLLDWRGTLNRSHERVRAANDRTEYLLVPASETGHGREIVITRKDVHEIQLAKGAIRAGIEILLKEAGIAAGEVGEWIIAGAFGTYLDLNSARRVGMFPAMPLERFHQVGNAAGVGAKQMLLSRQKRQEAGQIIDRVKYIELTVYPEFTHEFMERMYF